MKKIILLVTSIVLFSCASEQVNIQDKTMDPSPAQMIFEPVQIEQDYVKIIPEPKSMSVMGDAFFITNNVSIINNTHIDVSEVIKFFQDDFFSRTGVRLDKRKTKRNCIKLELETEDRPAEWYKLESTPKGVTIRAKTYAGFLYAFYSFLQLLPEQRTTDQNLPYSYIPCLIIEDEPRFTYRGFMLDVSRYFFSVNTIKKLIDKIAKLKINKFHLHLTDDSGFRFPFEGKIKFKNKEFDLSAFIKKTSYRTVKNKNSPHYNLKWNFIDITDPKDPWYKYKDNAYGGYYTREELKDLIQYAKIRNIEIIPEIEIPGHSYPLNYFFKEMRCDKKNRDYRYRGILTDICPTSEFTMVILKEMIRQIAEVFESPVLHIGSDEVKINNKAWYQLGSWWFCSRCEQKIKELEGKNARVNYKNLQKLQAWFLTQIEAVVAKNGKSMAMWADGIHGGFVPKKNTVVYFWNKKEDLILAKEKNIGIINCESWNYYLDLYQSEEDKKLKLPLCNDWSDTAPIIDLKKIYENNPSVSKDGISFGENQIGLQANMWTEYIVGFKKNDKTYSDEDHLMYMIFPRLIAVAERAWSPETKKNWDWFNIKLKKLSNTNFLEELN